MCEFVTMAVLGAAQAGMSIAGQRQQVAAQKQIQANASKIENQRYRNEAIAQRIRDAQEAVADAQKIQFNQRQARKTKATATVAALESGVQGGVLQGLLQNIDRQQATDNFSIQQNVAMRNVQSDLRLRDMGLNNRNNLLRINRPIEQPNVLSSLIDGAQFGMQMGSLGKEAGLDGFFGKNKSKTPKPDLAMNTTGNFGLTGDMIT